jgi:hypothetical protein
MVNEIVGKLVRRRVPRAVDDVSDRTLLQRGLIMRYAQTPHKDEIIGHMRAYRLVR